jgi:phage baseplate assembly protein gpV
VKPLRAIASVLAAAVLSGGFAAASPDKEKTKTHGVSVSGTVTAADDAAHTIVVRNSSGRETTLVRTAATKVNGKGLKVGDRVSARYLERDGKRIATSIRVEPPAVASATPTASTPSLR